MSTIEGTPSEQKQSALQKQLAESGALTHSYQDLTIVSSLQATSN